MSGVRRVGVTRYAAPLREGGSLPGLVEADDDGMYVLKFRGAGQGPRALVAELVAGGVGRALGLPVPELVLMDLGDRIGQAEPDPEIQDLLRASVGVNLGMDFLPGALAPDPATTGAPDPGFAARVVWFDALMLNVDRTPRNPNMLTWHGRPYLIDHGAALYPHHADWRVGDAWDRAFPGVADHVLLDVAGDITAADARLAPLLTPDVIDAVVVVIPDAWVDDVPGVHPDTRRAEYARFLTRRLASPRAFVSQAEAARAAR